jgi:hypothetical protein
MRGSRSCSFTGRAYGRLGDAMNSLAQMVSGYGQYHTNEADPANPAKKLIPYTTITLEGIRALVDNPQQEDKNLSVNKG